VMETRGCPSVVSQVQEGDEPIASGPQSVPITNTITVLSQSI
jgi:hypothetical protein